MKKALKSLIAAAGIAMMSGAASAHPHVFIESWSDVIFDENGKITGVYVEWEFDEFYSQAAIQGLDANGDGSYSAGEIEVLGRENIKALKDYDYFVYVRVNGKKIEYGDVTEFNQVLSRHQLKLVFKIPFKTPIDPVKQRFSYKMYDPSFYIAIDYAKEAPVNAVGDLPGNCKIELGPIAADEKTEETRSFLATKEPEWQPAEEEDFGALFAQPVDVVCGPKTALR